MSFIYLFPYEKIPAGSSIAIYGAGLVAEGYIYQLLANNYCKIETVVSADYKTNVKLKKFNLEVLAPETLAENNNYQYVVVAVFGPESRRQIVDKLRGFGIPEEKIISGICALRDRSYSQHGEDMIIINAFRHMGYFRDDKKPSYIDVGAHHPYELSNTALMYDMGCRGVNIEANPMLIKEFEKVRPDDINLCFGIGGSEGRLPFYMTEIEGLNSFKKENIEYNERLFEIDNGIKEKYEIKDVIELPVRTLPDVINEYCGGKWPDFMSMDIEGMEFESLSICDLSEGPKLMAVEVNYDGDLFIEMLDKKGYFPYLWYRENILFVKKEYEHLVHAHNER